ncbi:MAG: PepSY domain-containing protein [Candidatus Accumulibacter sp.]|jgi:uncharacterized iron-regulated membrane protein|nr:PepSY domain-containing protein [Accumulibacter sp.]
MKERFRQDMAWWHTWVGLVCGWLIFAIFFTGATAVFRGAGQHWLTPELHLPAAETRLDARGMVEAAERLLRAQGEDAPMWWMIRLPERGEAYFEAAWRRSGGWQSRMLDAATGEALDTPPRESRAMNMLYWLHFRLNAGDVGLWLVGAMAVAMLVLLVSGIVVHKKIFTDFFTFRPDKAPARNWLDAHNVSSVMTLPFALMISYTGLVIFCFDWMPAGVKVVGREAMRDEARPRLEIADAPGEPAPTLPLWSFVEQARAGLTEGQTLRFIQVFNPGGTQTQVRVIHNDDAVLWGDSDDKIFNGATGELLRQDQETEARAASAAQGVMRAMHEIRFAGPVLRWLYFLMSAGYCLMIATGLVL